MFADYKTIKGLGHTDRKLFNYMLQNIDEVIDMNVRDFAKVNYVSTATVVRFCRALNCNGFADLKKELKNYNDGHTIPSTKQNVDEIIEFFKWSMTDEFDSQIDDFVETLQKKRTVFFTGIGNSASVAQYGARYLSNAGLFCFVIEDPFYPNKLPDDDYCIVIISESGETVELIDQVARYKEGGATLLLITNHSDSTIAKMADLVFRYDVSTASLLSTYDLTTQVPAVYIIEQIGKRFKEISLN